MTLIMGNSHAMSSLNDEIIENSVNVAQHSEHYFYTYYKAKKLLSLNPSLKNLIVSFSPNEVNEGGDKNVLNPESK